MRIKRFMCIMDSMTDKELDSPDPKLFSFDPEPSSRVIRVAKGSGSRLQHVADLLGIQCPDLFEYVTNILTNTVALTLCWKMQRSFLIILSARGASQT